MADASETKIVERIKPLSPAHMERALVTLERAFANDPMFTWMFPIHASAHTPSDCFFGCRCGTASGTDM